MPYKDRDEANASSRRTEVTQQPRTPTTVQWGFINPETGDFIGVTEDGMRRRWCADLLAQIEKAVPDLIREIRLAPSFEDARHLLVDAIRSAAPVEPES